MPTVTGGQFEPHRLQPLAFALKPSRKESSPDWRVAGILESFTALKNIQRDRQKLGFPEGFDGVLTAWLSMLEQGQPHQEFFVRYVMPVDFEEGAWLSLNARLSSFETALLEASKH